MARQKKEEARRIGARIEALRKASGYTQEAVARKLKVGDRTYQSWEYGEAVPRWHNREKLAKMFRVSVEELMGVPAPGRSVSAQADSAALVALSERLGAVEQKLAELVTLISAPAAGDVPTPPGELDRVIAAAPPKTRGRARASSPPAADRRRDSA